MSDHLRVRFGGPFPLPRGPWVILRLRSLASRIVGLRLSSEGTQEWSRRLSGACCWSFLRRLIRDTLQTVKLFAALSEEPVVLVFSQFW
jgi:hypothetical protein